MLSNSTKIDSGTVYEIMYRIANGQWGSRIGGPGALAGIVDEIPITDMDVAELLVGVFENRIHYNGSAGWFEWDGTIHKLDHTDTLGMGLVARYSSALEQVIAALESEMQSWPDPETVEKGKKILGPGKEYLKRIKNNSGAKGLADMFKSYFRVDNNYFDKDQNWIVMHNGEVIDLAQTLGFGELVIREPDASRPVTRKLGVSVGEWVEGKPVEFLKLLRATVSSDEEVLYLQEAAGAAITGTGKAKNIPHLVGPPHTFKSVYLSVLDDVFGDYSGTLPATALVARYGGGTNFAQSRARGIRFLWLSEPQTTRTDDAFLKNLSGGGEPINTEEKGKDSVAWRAQCVLHIAANHVVKFDSRDPAIVSRMNIVEFHNQVKEEDMNPNLAWELMEHEGEEIFMWALQGAIRYSERGSIKVPDAIKARAQENVVGSSQPLRWLEEMIEMDQLQIDFSVPAYKCIKEKDAFEMFRMWCSENMEDLRMNQATWKKEIQNFMNVPQHKRKTLANKTKVMFGLTTHALNVEEGRVAKDVPRPVGEGGRKWSDLLD